MKSVGNAVRPLVLMAILAGPGTADPESQPPLEFASAAEGTWAADWTGIADRTYFFQWSPDMVNWYYAPFIDFGEGEHSRGGASSTPSFFVRLHHGDFEDIDSLEEAENADLDGDGLSNLFEVTFGYNPFDQNSSSEGADHGLDPDEDGMTNLTEQSRALDPMWKDNPKVQLEVIDY
jgi:hypothetical protein